MNDRTRPEEEYYSALQRLLDRKATISLNAVAIEAGKKQGSLRAARYPELVKEINRVIEIQAKNLIPNREPKFDEKIRARDRDLEALKMDYAVALQKVVSLERQVFQLQAELAEYRPAKVVIRELPRRR